MRLPAPARRAAAVAASLGVLAFWCGMLLAARRYPSGYDWRYMTISTLVYPDRNPAGWLWARGGLVLCGLGGLWWALTVRAGPGRAAGARRGITPLEFGYASMAACALVPEWRIPIPRLHECLALAGFLGICLGLAAITWRMRTAGAHRSRAVPAGPTWRAATLVGVVLAPIVLAALAQAYVSHVLKLPWVNIGWRARGVPVYLSFAFWEWVGCGIFSAYMLMLSRASCAP